MTLTQVSVPAGIPQEWEHKTAHYCRKCRRSWRPRYALQCRSMRSCYRACRVYTCNPRLTILAWSSLRLARSARVSVGFLGLGIFHVTGRACSHSSHSVFCSLLQVHFVPHPKGNCQVRRVVQGVECLVATAGKGRAEAHVGKMGKGEHEVMDTPAGLAWRGATHGIA